MARLPWLCADIRSAIRRSPKRQARDSRRREARSKRGARTGMLSTQARSQSSAAVAAGREPAGHARPRRDRSTVVAAHDLGLELRARLAASGGRRPGGLGGEPTGREALGRADGDLDLDELVGRDRVLERHAAQAAQRQAAVVGDRRRRQRGVEGEECVATSAREPPTPQRAVARASEPARPGLPEVEALRSRRHVLAVVHVCSASSIGFGSSTRGRPRPGWRSRALARHREPGRPGLIGRPTGPGKSATNAAISSRAEPVCPDI